ncbi:MAG: DNA mismatch repair endonuclease MutL [Clostridia bacterium]|nr:DNA mismatch repair endonuclease MutL [Clostridia bacterium]
MGNIVLLDDLTINKIAAGEVIERPANVVKELVENSIDAGATSISVEIENGGITYIRITDNGKGIAPDDIALAFERHATSKIRKAEDLIKVLTMGFRGEALASIASVAKVEMITRTKDRDLGTRIVVESGNIIEQEECGAPVGTSITVRELFFNTPVRYKFLKKDFTEGGYIEDAVSRIALINPNISFRMMNNKKNVLQTNGNGDMQSVVYSVYGRDIANNLVDVSFEYDGINITGVAGKPEIARSNRTNQMFYINGRFIKDKILSAATDEAYRTLIPNGKFGFCILNIRMNPEFVDVNVHPAKLEVRFSEEGKVFKAINIALKNALLKQDITIQDKENNSSYDDESENIDNKKEQKKGLFDMFRPKVSENTREVIEDKNSPITREREDNKTTEKQEISNNVNEIVKMKFDISDDALKENVSKLTNYENGNVVKNNVISIDFEKEYDLLKETNIEANKTSETKEPIEGNPEDFELSKERLNRELAYDDEFANNNENNEIKDNDLKEDLEVYSTKTQNNIFDNMNDVEETVSIPDYKIIGTAFSTYILLQLDDEIYILDQHAAHERVIYEKVKQNFYKDGGKDIQMLLMPDILELSKKDMRTVMDHLDLFEQAGFSLEEFGDNTIKIMGVPVICYEMNTKDLFIDILDGIDITNRTTTQEVEEKFLSTVACKAAIKANMSLEEREIRGLLDQLLLLENPFTCPHGRPTAIRITKLEIEKKFGRK